MPLCKNIFSIAIVTLLLVSSNVAASTTKTKGKRLNTTKPLTKEFKVNGIAAWSEAKKNGFLFYPWRVKGNKDGVGSSGKAMCLNPREANKWETCLGNGQGSQMVGGVNMLLYPQKWAGRVPTDSYSYFNLFSGKKLRSGWKIKRLVISGSYQWTNQKYTTNTNRIATRIKVSHSKSQSNTAKAMLKELVLVGPANAKWQDAFDVM
ncbi:MAG: hypothetical protein OQJ89_16720 [Kangiellaceae bacterium]|nr:hypothetical protein [Kangiellaceae bacterium]MCW8999612.1 hypothetical protein [Kangiellaceae bacterium]MCW9018619.1 hypothetical protein [Kangiellaceae bacterium]